MDTWISILGVIGLFILRLGVPLAITLAIGYWLRRLDSKWQAEAQAQGTLHQTEAIPELNELIITAEERRSTPPLKESGKVDFLAVESFRLNDRPCWLIKDCPESIRLHCPAYQYPYLLCWMARRQAIGQIPLECYQCEIFPLNRVVQKVTNGK